MSEVLAFWLHSGHTIRPKDWYCETCNKFIEIVTNPPSGTTHE
jgi:hypothetical protein